MENEIKRLFWGLEVHAPWPLQWPSGRLLKERDRHLTLVFLGNVAYAPLLALLPSFPHPPFKVGIGGYFKACLPLPPHHPRVMAWQPQFFEPCLSLFAFQHMLANWLTSHHYQVDDREWLPHLTLCRQPFDLRQWEKDFKPLPFYTSTLHLYESKGDLDYCPMWSFAIRPPFEEIDHTADMAFLIRGETLEQIYQHAFLALAFQAPDCLDFFADERSFDSLDDVIIALNKIIACVDREKGCSMKAVSFHGNLTSLPDSMLQWEMIVDV